MNKPYTYAALLFLLLLSLTGSSYGYHTNEERQTDFSAFTLKAKQVRIGLFQIEYGIFDSWTIGTYTAPWILTPIVGQFNGDVYSKYKFIDYKGWAASLRATLFYSRIRNASFGDLQDGDFNATVAPITATLSRVIDQRWTLSLETTWVQTMVNAGATSADDIKALGAAAQSNFQLALNAEYRINRVIALNLVTRYLPYVTAARINSTAQVDTFTSATIKADADIDAVKNSWIVQPGVTFSWQRFNLQLGLGYGDFFVPGLKIVSATRTFTPDLAVYFRF